MPNETLINRIETILDGVVSLGGQSERTGIVTNLEIVDASPAALTGYVIIKDSRDGNYIPAKKMPGILYSNGDLVNVLFVSGTEPVAFQQASESGGSPVSVSKLVSPDESIDPVLAADNNGDVTGENDLTLGDTARGNVFANWYDYNLISNDITGSHYNDNDSSYPAVFSEISAPQATNTSNLYGTWYIQNNSVTASWKYRFQTSTSPDSGEANLTVGPILFRDGAYTQDIDYYFGLYRDNAGIDEGTFNRVHLQWDSAGTQWQIRGETDDGATQTNSAWSVFGVPIHQPIWVRIRLAESGANIQCRTFFGTAKLGNSHTIFQTVNIAKASVTWGNVWIQYEQTRGTGVQDFLYLGGHDSESAA